MDNLRDHCALGKIHRICFVLPLLLSLVLSYPSVAQDAPGNKNLQADRKKTEKRWYALIDISRKYFREPGRREYVNPTPVEDSLATLALLSDAPATDYISRFYVLRILGKTAPREAREILLKHLENPQPDMKVAAAHALADYIKVTADYSLVPTLINAIPLNIAYYVDRFEGGALKGKLYPKNKPNCGLDIVVVNEQVLKALEKLLGRAIRFDKVENRKVSVIVETRADAALGMAKKARNFRKLTKVRNKYLSWWEENKDSFGKEER